MVVVVLTEFTMESARRWIYPARPHPGRQAASGIAQKN